MNSRRLKKVLAIDKVLLREKVCSEVSVLSRRRKQETCYAPSPRDTLSYFSYRQALGLKEGGPPQRGKAFVRFLLPFLYRRPPASPVPTSSLRSSTPGRKVVCGCEQQLSV